MVDWNKRKGYLKSNIKDRRKVEIHDYHLDGFMRTHGNYGGAPAYSPNSMGEWATQPMGSVSPRPWGSTGKRP